MANPVNVAFDSPVHPLAEGGRIPTPTEQIDMRYFLWQSAQTIKPLCGRISTFCSTYVTPFASVWGATRNATGLILTILTSLSFLGIISCPQLLVALVITFAVFVLVQGALAGGPTFIGNLCGAIKEYAKAKELDDPELYTSAKIKFGNALLSLAEGGFWIFIATMRLLVIAFPAIALFGILVGVSTHILFLAFFNISFAYMTGVSIYDFIRHKQFYNSINDTYLKYLLNLEGPELARELNRFEEQTSAECRASLEKWLNCETDNEVALLSKIKKASLQKMVKDVITIALGVIGLILSADFLLANITTPFTSDVIDWIAWVVINLAFLFLLDWEKPADAIQSAGATALTPFFARQRQVPPLPHSTRSVLEA